MLATDPDHLHHDPALTRALGDLCVECLDIEELSPSRLAAWEALELRALEGNPFLSPSFLLPSRRYLSPQERVLLLFVLRRDRPEELLGVAAFTPCAPTRRLPVPHLRAWRGEHSFLGNALLDRRAPREAAGALMGWLWSQRWRWQAVECIDHSLGGPQAAAFADAAQALGMRWHEYGRQRRAALYPARLTHEHLDALWTGKERRNLDRRRRRLRERGLLRYHTLAPGPDADALLARFLHMEDMGWKGEAQTSLLASHAHHRFFGELFERAAARQRLFFTALYLNDDPIAVSVNLRSGDAGFAFKLGWDTALRAHGPGVLLAEEMARHLADAPPGLALMDSCAAPGSFVERCWPHRRALTSGVYTLGPLSGALVASLRALQRARLTLAR